jgi:hypothetical protein
MWVGVLLALLALSGSMTRVSAEPGGPWRLGRSLDLPAWLEVSGEQRTRYETLDGQFRAGRDGGDQALTFRTTLMAQLKGESGRLVGEILDARQYLSDDGSPIDNTMVNPVDVLQAHVRWDAGDLIAGGTNTIRMGRETLDLGNRRLMARNAYRNTINSFTGIDWLWEGDRQWLRAFYFLPVHRLPDDVDSLLANDVVADTQTFDQQFWGVYGSWNRLPQRLRLEGYYFRLQEEATSVLRRRHLNTPGFRLYRLPARGQWDMELECSIQFGSSQTRPGAGQTRLDHRAHHEHIGVGYTFDSRWVPRVEVRYDHASGDADPNDGRNGRFDTLFGARRFEFGPTGIYGAIARANLSSPAYGISIRPTPPLELSVMHRFVWLAESRDAWVAAGLRDSSGASGRELGQQVELRARWEVVPGNFRVDTGVTGFFLGDFTERVPGGNRQDPVRFAYLEMTLQF